MSMDKQKTKITTGWTLALAAAGFLTVRESFFAWIFGKLFDRLSSWTDAVGLSFDFVTDLSWKDWFGVALAATAAFFLFRGYRPKATREILATEEVVIPVPSSRFEQEPPTTHDIVRNIKLSRAQDVTSRWWVSFAMNDECARLQICLDLQYYSVSGERDHPRWGGVTRHVVESRENLARSQTLSVQFVRDAVGYFGNAPHWEIPGPREQPNNYVPAMAGFVRGAITFIAGDREQQHRFIVLPWEPDQALVIIGEEMLCGENFWSDDYRPMNLHDARGIRTIPRNHEA